MFAFLTNLYRRIEAALTREAVETERTADLRKAYNDHVEGQLKAMGVIAATEQPVNRIADVPNGKRKTTKK